MEFQQLEMFAAVVEERSVSRAGERVCRTAPAVSIALRKLEEEIGTPLFDRSERQKFQLTALGKLFYSYATRILEMRQEATAAISELSPVGRRILRIGTYESASLYLLPSLIQAFNESHQGVKTQVVCGESDHLLRTLRYRAIDLALIADAPDDPELQRQLISQDELVLIASPQHRLAGMTQVHVRDLGSERLVIQGTKSIVRERLVRGFQEVGVSYDVSVENVPIEAIKRMVADGLGIGLVPLACVQAELSCGKLSAVKLGGIDCEWNLWLVTRKGHPLSTLAKAFVEVSLEVAHRWTKTTNEGPAKTKNQVFSRRAPVKPSRRSYC